MRVRHIGAFILNVFCSAYCCCYRWNRYTVQYVKLGEQIVLFSIKL